MRRDLDEARFSGVRIGLYIIEDQIPRFDATPPEYSIAEEIFQVIQVFCDKAPERCALLRSIDEYDDTLFNPKQARALLKEIQVIGWHLKADVEMSEKSRDVVLKTLTELQEVVRRVAKGEGRFLIFVGRG